MSEERPIIHTSTRSRAHKKAPFTPEERKEKQSLFLEAFREVGVIKYACKAAGINRRTYYNWKNSDKAFQAELPDATEDANDTLEYAAFEQSVLGTDEPAISMGQLVYEYEPDLDEHGNQRFDSKGKPLMKRSKQVVIRKYSPQLLITLLKARMPEKYRDKQTVDLNANVSAQVQANHEITISPRDLTDEELTTMKALAKNAMERKKQKGEQ